MNDQPKQEKPNVYPEAPQYYFKGVKRSDGSYDIEPIAEQRPYTVERPGPGPKDEPGNK